MGSYWGRGTIGPVTGALVQAFESFSASGGVVNFGRQCRHLQLNTPHSYRIMRHSLALPCTRREPNLLLYSRLKPSERTCQPYARAQSGQVRVLWAPLQLALLGTGASVGGTVAPAAPSAFRKES